MYCKYFLPFCDLCFHFLMGIFRRTNVFILIKSNASIFSFMVLAFCVLRNLCLDLRVIRISCVFFELLLCHGVK